MLFRSSFYFGKERSTSDVNQLKELLIQYLRNHSCVVSIFKEMKMSYVCELFKYLHDKVAPSVTSLVLFIQNEKLNSSSHSFRD